MVQDRFCLADDGLGSGLNVVDTDLFLPPHWLLAGHRWPLCRVAKGVPQAIQLLRCFEVNDQQRPCRLYQGVKWLDAGAGQGAGKGGFPAGQIGCRVAQQIVCQPQMLRPQLAAEVANPAAGSRCRATGASCDAALTAAISSAGTCIALAEVAVFVLAPDVCVADLPDVAFRRRELFRPLVQAFPDRVQVFERIGDDGSMTGPNAYVHSKLIIVDDEACSAGSTNSNRRSWFHDSEVVATVVDNRCDPRGQGSGRVCIWWRH